MNSLKDLRIRYLGNNLNIELIINYKTVFNDR